MAESANLFLVTGTDEPLIASEAEAIARRLAGDSPDAFSLDVIRHPENGNPAETLRDLLVSLRSPSFLGGRKTVWLQNFPAFNAEGTAKSKTPDAVAFRELAGLIREGIPSDMALVLSGPGVDARKALHKACKAAGEVIILVKPERRDYRWEEQMRGVVRKRAAAKGIRLPEDVLQYLVAAVGTETGWVDGELEKLACYCGGPDREITVAAAKQVCPGHGESISWVLTEAVGQRRLSEALRQLDVLLRQAKDPKRTARSLLRQVADHFRYMLQMKLFMAEADIRGARDVYGIVQSIPADDKASWQARGIDVVGLHPYRARKLAEDAGNYGGPELVAAIPQARDAYARCISSAVPARVALEELLIRLVGSGRRARAGRGRR